MKLKILLLTLLTISCKVAFATSTKNFPSLIPLKFLRPPATDLIYKGQVLSLSEAKKLHDSGVKLEELDPEESLIWQKKVTSQQMKDSSIPVKAEGHEVKFLTSVRSASGNYRFSASVSNDEGTSIITIGVSKRLHNVLLRRNLLRKLGYQIPGIKYLKSVRVKFDSVIQKESFLDDLKTGTLGEAERWVVKNIKNSKEILLQDAIATSSNNLSYNLAEFVPEQIIQGRRVMNALSIPYGLVEVPESANIFPWRGARLIFKAVKIDSDESWFFRTPYEDALWILKRMKHLTKKDLVEIVSRAHFPVSVRKLLVEKLASRLNSIFETFGVAKKKLSVNENVNYGASLVNGELRFQKKWAGYGSRFTYEDPENPLSKSEIFSFFKSKGLSNSLSHLISEFNRKYGPATDLSAKIFERQSEKARESFLNFIRTGESQETNFGLWAIPRFGSKLIASRDVVAGSYLGTDNPVQLVDTVGLSVNAGAYIGTDGIPTPWRVSGDIRGTITRKFSHITPILSIKKALKTPFKNMLVSLTKKKFGRILDDLQADRIEGLSVKKQRERLIEVLTSFKEAMGVGESLLISDSIGGSLSFNAGYSFDQIIQGYAGFNANQIIISRLHILRSDSDTIQIYKDIGRLKSVGVNFGIRAHIPILEFNFKVSKGKARVKFQKIDISSPVVFDKEFKDLSDKKKELAAKNAKELFQGAQALRQVLLSSSTDLLNAIRKPYILHHNFVEKERGASFLLWKWKKQATTDSISIQHPKGDVRSFYKSVIGERSGKNYQKLAIDTLNALISRNSNSSLVIDSASNGNPGDTFKGEQVSRVISVEGELSKAGFDSPFVKLKYLWKGWSIGKDKVNGIIRKINQRFGHKTYHPLALRSTEKLSLYNINLDFFIYKKSLKTMLAASNERVESIFYHMSDFNLVNVYKRHVNITYKNYEDEQRVLRQAKRRVTKKFIRSQRKANQYFREGNYPKYVKHLSKMISTAESVLTMKGLKYLMGGDGSFYVSSKVTGFREGDESGDTPYVANSIGEVDSKYYEGPLRSIQNQMGMTESEFSIYWLLGKL